MSEILVEALQRFANLTYTWETIVLNWISPVVNAYTVFPELQTITGSKNLLEVVNAVYSLYGKVTMGFMVDEIPDREFLRTCALISMPKAYKKSGVHFKEVDNMLHDYDASRPTVTERIEARGIKKAQTAIIKNLMNLRGWTQQQTIDFL